MISHSIRIVAFALIALSTSAAAIDHVFIESRAPHLDAVALEAAGYDLIHGSVTAAGFEGFVSDEERAALQAAGFRLTTISEGRPFADIRRERSLGRAAADYPSLDEIHAQMLALQATYPAIAEWVDLTALYQLPPTTDGNHIYAMKISDSVEIDEAEPATLIVSAHHSRELVTPVIAIHAIEELTSGYGVDPDITSLVDGNEIWIAPVWNPDGYRYVFEVDNWWRKNRTIFPGGVGVDLNRNYPFGWTSSCDGSTSASSNTYKGPSPASEVETITMMAWSRDQHFGKVLDFHSSGREVVWGLGCLSHPLDSFWRQEAWLLGLVSGYQGDHRPAIASGEHFQWQLVEMDAYGFLVETHVSFQPSYASAVAEAERVWPGIVWTLQRKPLAWGTVVDSFTGEPVDAKLEHVNLGLSAVDHDVEGKNGTYYAWLPNYAFDLEVVADGYESSSLSIDGENGYVRRDIFLNRETVDTPDVATGFVTRLLPSPLGIGSIRYAIATPGPVRLDLFDVRGALVRTLADAPHGRGVFDVVWDGRDRRDRLVSAGVYYVRLETPDAIDRQKLVRLD